MPKKPETTEKDMRLLAVDTDTAAKMIGVSPKTLRNWRYARGQQGPRYSRAGGKIVYPVSELEAFLAENMVR